MRIVSRYLIARFLGLFAAILFASTLVVVIVEMLLNFGDMLHAEDGIAGVATYLFLRIPSYYLRDLVPISAFAAAFFSLGLASHWLEIMALKAGGISPHRAVLPILATAAVLAIGAFAVNETLVIRAIQGWKHQKSGDEDSLTFRSGSFWYHRGRTIYNIADADRETRTLRGVRLFELDRNGRLVRSIDARRVHVEGDRIWRVEHALIRHFDPANVDAAPRIERKKSAVVELFDPSDEALMRADASTLSLGRLREYIAARVGSGDQAARFEALLHARLSDPICVLVFVLLGLPLGLRVEQTRSLGRSAVIGVATVALFYLLRNTGATLGAEGVLPAAVAPWSTLVLFSGWGLWQVARVPR